MQEIGTHSSTVSPWAGESDGRCGDADAKDSESSNRAVVQEKQNILADP